MAQNNERNPHTLLIPIGSLGAGLSKTVVGPKLLRDAVILEVALVDSVGIAADNTNYMTAKLRDHTANIDLASGDTKAADQGALTAYEGLDLPLVPTPNDAHEGGPSSGGPGVQQTIADRGDSLVAVATSSGTAVLTAAALSVTLYYL